MSSLYTTKQAAELGEKLRECVTDSTLIRMMGELIGTYLLSRNSLTGKQRKRPGRCEHRTS